MCRQPALTSGIHYPHLSLAPPPTFSDALALVRRGLWAHLTFQMSVDDAQRGKVPRPLLERFNDLLAYIA